MSDKFAISFVIPAFNEERLIGSTLRTITDEVQRLRISAEIVVIDDGSTDSTRSVVRSFREVTLVASPKVGLSGARQIGFLATTGELVANVDADTMIPQGWIERVLHEFQANQQLVCVSGPLIYYDLPRLTRAAVRVFYYCGYLLHGLNQFIFRVGSLIQGGNFVVTRAALESIGGYNQQFTFYGEDTDLARRITAIGRVKFNFALSALSSGRRLRQEGVLRMGLRYALNFLWATWLHRPFSLESKYIR